MTRVGGVVIAAGLVVLSACGVSFASPLTATTPLPTPLTAANAVIATATNAVIAAPATTAPAGPGTAPVTGGLDALEVLAGMRLEAPNLGAPGYDRESWPHWLDVDQDGCDTRQEVLRAEAVGPAAVSGSCQPAGAQWRSLYDGAATADPADLDVDHLVPLEEAHRSGGWAWDGQRKAAFANDLGDERSLAATSASSNRAKGSRDPAGWLPDQGVCRYVGDWIAVKARWSLSVDAEEATELSDLLLGECAGLDIAPWDVVAPMAPPETPHGAEDGQWPDCAAARAAGVAPVHAGDPGYGRHLDGDANGVGCQ